jgi:hypothetical protein
MYRILRTVVALAVTALLCLIALAPAASADSTRPFSGRIAGGAVLVPDTSCPFGFRTDTWGTGNVTHFGRTSMTASHCTQFTGAPETGTQTFVAANGDKLEVTYTLTGEPVEPAEGALLSGHGQTIITGGTGRFAGANGEFVVDFRAIVHIGAPMELWLTWHGEEITY